MQAYGGGGGGGGAGGLGGRRVWAFTMPISCACSPISNIARLANILGHNAAACTAGARHKNYVVVLGPRTGRPDHNQPSFPPLIQVLGEMLEVLLTGSGEDGCSWLVFLLQPSSKSVVQAHACVRSSTSATEACA